MAEAKRRGRTFVVTWARSWPVVMRDCRRSHDQRVDCNGVHLIVERDERGSEAIVITQLTRVVRV